VAASRPGPFLYPPAVAYRERPAGFTGTPMPKDEAMAPNPPFGAAVDYVVPPGASAVTLTLTDANGAVVEQFSSADKPRRPNPSELRVAPEWVPAPMTLSAEPGMHRFVWTLHYAPPAGVTGRRGGGEGVWASPGTYTATLDIDGNKVTQPLLVKPDPRINLPQAAYEAQFALARDIEQERGAIAAAMRDAGALTKKIAGKPDLIARLDGITGGAQPDIFPPPPAPTTSLRFLAGQLAGLQGAVDGADAAPTADAKTAWAKLKPAADQALAALKAFESSVH